MSTLMHNFCGKMLNVTKHQAVFRLTMGLESPEDVLAASSRHASRHTTTERLRLYWTQPWQERQSRRQARLGDKEGNESRFEGEGRQRECVFFCISVCCFLLQACICKRGQRRETISFQTRFISLKIYSNDAFIECKIQYLFRLSDLQSHLN